MKKTTKQSEWPKSPEEYYPYLQRIGHLQGDYDFAAGLRWALSLVDKPGGWNGLTPGDRQNLRIEIGLFAHLTLQNRVGDILGIPKKAPPTDKEAQQILTMFDEVLWSAIRREPIFFDVLPGRRELTFEESSGRYGELSLHPPVDRGWAEDARAVLASAILRAGHLLKVCPAPAARGGPGETCDTRFLASRPNQAYCSGRCQTRAATRAYRDGDSTPVAKMLAAKNKASRKSRKGA